MTDLNIKKPTLLYIRFMDIWKFQEVLNIQAPHNVYSYQIGQRAGTVFKVSTSPAETLLRKRHYINCYVAS